MVLYSISIPIYMNGFSTLKTRAGATLTFPYLLIIAAIVTLTILDFNMNKLAMQTIRIEVPEKQVDSLKLQFLVSYLKQTNSTLSVATPINLHICNLEELKEYYDESFIPNTKVEYVCLTTQSYTHDYMNLQRFSMFSISNSNFSESNNNMLDTLGFQLRYKYSYYDIDKDIYYSKIEVADSTDRNFEFNYIKYVVSRSLYGSKRSELITAKLTNKFNSFIIPDPVIGTISFKFYFDNIYNQTLVSSLRITALMSRIMGYISTVSLIFAFFSYLASEYFILKHIMENLLSKEDKDCLAKAFGLEFNDVKIKLSFANYIKNMMIPCMKSSGFNHLIYALYEKISISRIMLAKNERTVSAITVNRQKKTFFERIDFLSTSKSFKFRGKDRFINRVSNAFSLLAVITTSLILMYCTKDFLSGENPELFYKSIFISQIDESEEERQLRVNKVSMPILLNIPSSALMKI